MLVRRHAARAAVGVAAALGLTVGLGPLTARSAPDPGAPVAAVERDNLVYEMTEGLTARINYGDSSKVCAGGESITEVGTPVRAGSVAFEHLMQPCGERAELSFQKLGADQRYLYSWSAHIPDDFAPLDGSGENAALIMQMSAWPDKRGSDMPCSGVGHYLEVASDGRLGYTLQRQTSPDGPSSANTCEKFDDLFDVSTAKGGWLDIVLEIDHTAETDGVLNLWVKPEGGTWQQVLDYTGATWWSGIEPNLKTGIYTGDPDNVADTIGYTTDEYRVGGAGATIADVSPDGTEPTAGRPAAAGSAG
ncbi:MAG: heparin lyase I family protein [Phycicoccus sp.]